jgi:hypothetical protein
MAIDQAAYEAGKTKRKPKNKPQPETINADFSHDYQAGQALAHRKLQAFNQGYQDEMSRIQDFLHTEFLTTTNTFQIEVTHQRSLPAAETREIQNQSFVALLYGSVEGELTDVQ